MKPILKDRSFQLSIVITLIFLGTGIAFLFLGLVNYSWVFFILLPVVLGVALGAIPDKKYVLIGAIITTILVLLALLFPGLSGLLCIVMSLSLIIALIFLGYVITHLIKRYKQIKGTNSLPLLLLPIFPFLVAAPTERFLNNEPEIPGSTGNRWKNWASSRNMNMCLIILRKI
jgi:MFS family permease